MVIATWAWQRTTRNIGLRVLVFCLLTPFLFMSGTAQAQEDDIPFPILPAEQARFIQVLSLLAHDAPLVEAFFSPNGTFYVAGTLDGRLHFWRARQDRGVLAFVVEGYQPGVTQVGFNAPEDLIAVSLTSSNGETIINVLDTQGGEITSFTEHNAPLLDIAFIDTQGTIASRDLLDTLHIWDGGTGEILQSHEQVLAFAVAPDDTQLTLVYEDNRVSTGDFTADEDDREILENIVAENLSYSPGGRWLALWGAEDRFTVWDAANNERLFRVNSAVDAVAWTPNGRFIITQGFGLARVYALVDIDERDIQEGDITDDFRSFLETGGLRQLAIAPDGSHIVTLDGTDVGRVWSLDEFGDAQQIRSLQGIIDEVEISPDSQTIVAFRKDFPTRFFTLSSGELRGERTLPEPTILSPDWLLLASYTDNIAAWRGFPDYNLEFDYPAVGRPRGGTSLRLTPSDEIIRIAALDSGEGIFPIARTDNGEWLKVFIEDGTQGWVQTATLVINVEQDYLDSFPIIETAITQFQNPDDDLPFLLMPDPMPINGEDSIAGCGSLRTVIVLDHEMADSVSYSQVDCGELVGWVSDEYLVFD